MPETSDNNKLDEPQSVAKAATDEVSMEGEARSAASSSDSSGRKDPRIWGNIESMFVIQKSPYEPPNASAEVGESVFDDVKKLLVAPEGGNGAVHPQAVRLFGTRLAESVVVASYQIGKSGMLFSPGWQDGKIRGVQCGWIPKPILLLCLHEQRFVRANEALLAGIIRDLGVTKIVSEGIEEWNLDRDFLNLSSNTTYTYTKHKNSCYKCEIFVARAFRSTKVLKRKDFEPSLWEKVLSCLKIMNEHVRVAKNAISKRLSELEKDEAPEVVVKKTTGKRKKSGESANESKRRRKERQESMDGMIGMLCEQATRMQDLLEALKKQQREERILMEREIRQEVREEIMQELGLNNGKKRK